MSNDLKDLINKSESENLEYKGARAPLLSIGRAVCAMLNQQGGTLVWGVTDHGSLSGLAGAESKREQLYRYIMDRISPRPFLDVSVESFKNKSAVVILIPFGYDKPYSFNREIWVRIGCSTLRAGEERSAALVDEGALELRRWEREPVPGFDIEDCDKQELKKARKRIIDAGRFGGDLSIDDSEMLRQLYVQRNGRLTNASLVLFAGSPRIWTPNVYIRIVTFASDSSGNVANDITVDAPAASAIEQAVTVIQQRTGISSRFVRTKLEREDRPAYAYYALREALVNAVAHRSYDMVGAAIRVEIFPDYLVISNPGSLPQDWTVSILKKEHKSIPFNPDISHVLYMQKFMDQLGKGTQRIVDECHKLGAKTPVWRSADRIVSIKLFVAPSPTADSALSARQSEFLNGIDANTDFKTAIYIRDAGVSDRQARRDLSEMEKLGFIKRYGKGPATVYRKVE